MAEKRKTRELPERASRKAPDRFHPQGGDDATEKLKAQEKVERKERPALFTTEEEAIEVPTELEGSAARRAAAMACGDLGEQPTVATFLKHGDRFHDENFVWYSTGDYVWAILDEQSDAGLAKQKAVNAARDAAVRAAEAQAEQAAAQGTRVRAPVDVPKEKKVTMRRHGNTFYSVVRIHSVLTDASEQASRQTPKLLVQECVQYNMLHEYQIGGRPLTSDLKNKDAWIVACGLQQVINASAVHGHCRIEHLDDLRSSEGAPIVAAATFDESFRKITDLEMRERGKVRIGTHCLRVRPNLRKCATARACCARQVFSDEKSVPELMPPSKSPYDMSEPFSPKPIGTVAGLPCGGSAALGWCRLVLDGSRAYDVAGHAAASVPPGGATLLCCAWVPPADCHHPAVQAQLALPLGSRSWFIHSRELIMTEREVPVLLSNIVGKALACTPPMLLWLADAGCTNALIERDTHMCTRALPSHTRSALVHPSDLILLAHCWQTLNSSRSRRTWAARCATGV